MILKTYCSITKYHNTILLNSIFEMWIERLSCLMNCDFISHFSETKMQRIRYIMIRNLDADIQFGLKMNILACLQIVCLYVVICDCPDCDDNLPYIVHMLSEDNSFK